jgi:acetoacetyl-CoA synthetase
MTQPLWQPTKQQIEGSNLHKFMDQVNHSYGMTISNYDELYEWSVKDLENFWQATWDFCDVLAHAQATTVLQNHENMEQSRFYPQARLNYAENLLRQTGEQDAIVFWGESKVKQRLSHDQLRRKVAQMASALRAEGVKPGDRVAGFVPNSPEAVIAMLATASIGAVWSSCSPDFGVQGVLDRFSQIEPKVIFSCDGYYYNGKVFDSTAKLKEIVDQLPSVRKTIVWAYAGGELSLDQIPHGISWDAFVQDHLDAELRFESLPFNHPLFVMFSSGTTGKPKCIVHGAGGTLLEHLKEHQLHCDVKPGDRVFYFTTCGWMMWNWLVSALASQATLLLYDGSPMEPDGNILFDYADAEGMTLFGASAKYIDALAKAGVKPMGTHKLSTVRMMTSTGSPLVPESFDYVYSNIKKDMCLASISGGTDIIGCFAMGNPIGAVWRGELQARGLGLAIDVYDDSGHPLREQKGELVCTEPFPSMPIGFWNDDNHEKYHKAYFDRFPNIWCHGDFVEITEHNGLIIYGRSDAVLNPGGIRIGTAEIYRLVEQIDEVIESIAVGQDWDGDVRVVLFVKLRPGITLSDELQKRIRLVIRQNASPRHVPAKIIQVADIPRTRSGKIVELAVRDVIHDRQVKNLEALANPEALDLYKNLQDLKSA